MNPKLNVTSCKLEMRTSKTMNCVYSGLRTDAELMQVMTRSQLGIKSARQPLLNLLWLEKSHAPAGSVVKYIIHIYKSDTDSLWYITVNP